MVRSRTNLLARVTRRRHVSVCPPDIWKPGLGEHLNFNSLQSSEIKDYIMSCDNCSEIGLALDNFGISRKCECDCHTKIPSFNRQLLCWRCAFSASVVLTLFYTGRA